MFTAETWLTLSQLNWPQVVLVCNLNKPGCVRNFSGPVLRGSSRCCVVCAGAAVDYRDGFVGCLRALMVNGKIMDLRGKVERGEVTYGVASGESRGS